MYFSRSMIAYVLRMLLLGKSWKKIGKLLSANSLKIYPYASRTQGCIYLHPLQLLVNGILPGQIVNVRFSAKTKREKISRTRLLRVASTRCIDLCYFMIGQDDIFNLFGQISFEDIHILSIEPAINLSSHKPLPKAYKVSMAPIKQHGSRHEKAVAEALRNFSKNERILYSGDIISIWLGDPTLGETSNKKSFRIDCPESPAILHSGTSVYELTSISSRTPFGTTSIPITHLPQYLQTSLDRMASIYNAYFSVSEHPLVMLLAGSPGMGKTLLAKHLAAKTHQNYIEISSYETWSEVSAQSEQKLKLVIEKAKACQPCLLHISTAPLVGYDANSLEIDQRVLHTLQSGLEDSSQILIIFSCLTEEATSLHSSLRSLVLYEFQMNNMDEIIREELFSRYLNSNAHFASKHSSGFSLSEINGVIRDATFYQNNHVMDQKSAIEQALDERNASFADSIGAPKIPSVSWDDVGGLEDTKELIIESIRASMEGGSHQLRRSGVILFGPPGCGKTLIAKAVATEFKVAFLSVKGPELLNKYIGQSEENLRKVFERARQASPCVIFFDELDSLAPNRGRSGDSGGVMDRIVSQLLSELDVLHSDPLCKVFVMGATNRADLLDQSLLTPGRFDKVINVSPGTSVEAKTAILKAVSRNVNVDKTINLEEIASACPTVMSGAELYSVVSNATMVSLREQINLIEEGKVSLQAANVVITRKHLLEAVKTADTRKLI